MSKAHVEIAILAHRRLRHQSPTLSSAASGTGTEVSDTTVPPALLEAGAQRSPEPRDDND